MTDNLSFDRDAERRAKQLSNLDRLAQRFGTSLSGAFAKNVQEGRRLDGVLERIGRTLLNASLRAAMKPLRSGLTDLFKNAFSNSSSEGADATDAASEMAKGGVISRGQVMPFAKGGVVAAPTYFPLARGMGLMGEQGAEAVMPLARGPDGRLGVRAAGAGAGPVQVTVNIATPDAESFRRSEAQVAAALARAVARGQRGL
ncbi:MAG: phage tail protein [Geminicoccaceae bacterium]|jgi:phage-related minor tail protein|nr:phage tail protein [Geminicoccaceae bacterium]MDF3064339.1 phage tail protein [Microvirga sp.]